MGPGVGYCITEDCIKGRDSFVERRCFGGGEEGATDKDEYRVCCWSGG